MAGEWEQTTLGEHVELATGPAFKSAEFSNSGVRLARGDNVKEGFFQWGEKERFWPSLTADLEKFLLQSGDVLLGMDGSKVGKNWVQVREKDVPCLLVQRVARIRAKKTLDQSLLPYLLGTFIFREYVDRVRTGTSIPHISGGQIREFPIPLPPLPEQKAIAHVLGSLDDKIELNRRMNETLEGMAQALFKSWFVDFDPVIDNALAAGNPIPEPLSKRAETRRQAIANGTANRESAQDFPASFRFTEELGYIPEGWEVKELKELCIKIQNGGTPRRSTSEFWDDGTIPWLTSGEVRQPLITKTNNFITDLGLSKSSAKWIPAHSTVVAMYGATAGQVSFTSRALTTNQAICALVPKEGFKFFNYLNLRESVTHLENQARGSAQQNISKGIIETTKTILPAPNIAKSFESFCIGIFEKWTKNTLSCATLAKLRDVLLPKLISGELRIPQAEKMVEEAVA